MSGRAGPVRRLVRRGREGHPGWMLPEAFEGSLPRQRGRSVARLVPAQRRRDGRPDRGRLGEVRRSRSPGAALARSPPANLEQGPFEARLLPARARPSSRAFPPSSPARGTPEIWATRSGRKRRTRRSSGMRSSVRARASVSSPRESSLSTGRGSRRASRSSTSTSGTRRKSSSRARNRPPTRSTWGGR